MTAPGPTRALPAVVIEARSSQCAHTLTTPDRASAGQGRGRGRSAPARLARRVLRVPAVVVAALVAAELVGAPLVGLVLGVVLVVQVLRWWAAVVEPWLFAPRWPATRVIHEPPHGPVEAIDHVAFARALSLVAGRYLVECERQATDGTETGGRS